MKILLTSDLHLSLPWFEWLIAKGISQPEAEDRTLLPLTVGIEIGLYSGFGWARQAIHEMMDQTIRRRERNRSPFAVEHVNWEFMR